MLLDLTTQFSFFHVLGVIVCIGVGFLVVMLVFIHMQLTRIRDAVGWKAGDDG